MALGKTTYSANVAIDSTLRALKSNKRGRISAVGSSHQVVSTQIEVPKTVPEGTASQAVTGVSAEAPATKELEKYVNATENSFEIDLDYNPG